MKLNRILIGNALDLATELPDSSIHTICTSPPYWGLRDYGIEPVAWPEVAYSPMPGLPPLTIPPMQASLGLEAEPWAYVGHLVAIFRELRRALRGDGTLWLNLGDSYAGSGKGRNSDGSHQEGGKQGTNTGTIIGKLYKTQADNGLKPKDLIGIPWMVAKAFQADGWYLRSDIIWAKPNPMPESVRDRPTKAHEYLFLLSKSERYYYDAEAIRESNADPTREDFTPGKMRQESKVFLAATGDNHRGFKNTTCANGRNRRTVWTIATKPYSAAHFATFPPDLVEPCILASTSAYGCCAECGAGWERVVEREREIESNSYRYTGNSDRNDSEDIRYKTITSTLGWQPTCNCPTTQTVPAIVLDPFLGSGTTAKVAIKHRRSWLGFELNETYVKDLVDDRLNGTQIRMMA